MCPETFREIISLKEETCQIVREARYLENLWYNYINIVCTYMHMYYNTYMHVHYQLTLFLTSTDILDVRITATAVLRPCKHASCSTVSPLCSKHIIHDLITILTNIVIGGGGITLLTSIQYNPSASSLKHASKFS